MQIQDFSFGSIRIDGTTHEYDVVIEGGEIRKRKKKPSKKFLAQRTSSWTRHSTLNIK